MLKAEQFKVEFRSEQSGPNSWDKQYWFSVYTSAGKSFGLINRSELEGLRDKINAALENN